MKNFIVQSFWSRKAISAFFIAAAVCMVACGDSSSASAEASDEPVSEESSSSLKKLSSSSVVASETKQSSSSSAKSSSSSIQKNSSSSSKKGDSGTSAGMTSSSVKASSSSSVKSSSSWGILDWSLPKEVYLNPNIDYGMVTDDRDGKTYKTVKIGEQTWMAENLNFDPGQGGSGDAKYDWSWCYGDVPEHCDVTGRLYTWAAAIDSVKLANDVNNPQDCGFRKTCALPAKVQGLCPSGWHLPSYNEWNALFTAVGGRSKAGKVLKSQRGWYKNGNGTDAFGFSALPAGYRYNGNLQRTGYNAYFWSATEEADSAYVMRLLDDYENVFRYNEDKNIAFSVRCLKDGGEVAKSSSSESVSSSSSVALFSSSSGLTIPADWSWSVPKELRLNPEIEYDSIKDSRDGKVYKTVKIGDQTWMAENLNYYDAKDMSVNGDSWCFGKSNNKDSSTCDVAGRLYTWAAAIDSVTLYRYKSINCGYGGNCNLLPDTVYGICPSGWHLPSYREWKDLFSAVGDASYAGKILKSQSGWENKGNGSDIYGFSALPAGDRGPKGDFYYDGAHAFFWSSTTSNRDDAYSMELNNHFDRADLDLSEKSYGFSVRCLKNE